MHLIYMLALTCINSGTQTPAPCLHVLQEGDSPVLLPYICKFRPCPTTADDTRLENRRDLTDDFDHAAVYDLLGNRHQYVGHKDGGSSGQAQRDQHYTSGSDSTSGRQHYIRGVSGWASQGGDQHYVSETVTEAEVADLESQGDQNYIRQTVTEAEVADLEEREERAAGKA
jgi:hypothetical protein